MIVRDFLNPNKVNEEKIANAVADGEIPKIESSEELEIYLKYKIKDAEFAGIFTRILNKIGRDGVIEIKKGGDGNPYEVEYVPSKLRKMMSKKESKKRKKEIIEILNMDSSLSEVEIQKYQEELAQLSDGHAIIWVNLKNSKDFSLKEEMFAQAVNTITEALTKK
jgi:hypothetical protein